MIPFLEPGGPPQFPRGVAVSIAICALHGLAPLAVLTYRTFYFQPPEGCFICLSMFSFLPLVLTYGMIRGFWRAYAVSFIGHIPLMPIAVILVFAAFFQDDLSSVLKCLVEPFLLLTSFAIMFVNVNHYRDWAEYQGRRRAVEERE